MTQVALLFRHPAAESSPTQVASWPSHKQQETADW